jgi:hypothetical protein
MMKNVLDDYLFTHLGFTTYQFFPHISFYCAQIHLSTSKYRKNHYLKKMRKELENNPYFSLINSNINFFIKNEIEALKNSSILIYQQKKELRLYKKIKTNQNIQSIQIKENNPSLDNFTNLTLIIDEAKKKDQLSKLYSHFNIKFLEIKNEESGIIYDQIKLLLLQDDSEIYLVDCGILNNYILNAINQLDKIGINVREQDE